MTALVTLDRIGYTYAPDSPVRRTALVDATLAVRRGETLGLIGRTGSGKSTLLRVLAGEFRPAAGTVAWDAALTDGGPRPRPGRIGLVFQYPEDQLFEETVFDDVAFGPRQTGMAPDAIDRAVVETLDRLGFPTDRIRECSPFDLSGGQKRKVAIAGVLALKPALLILDEPTSGLDPASKRKVLALLAGLRAEGTTIVLVSHDLEAIAAVCDRVACLDGGAIAACGEARAILTDVPLLTRLRIGAPPAPAFLQALAAAGLPVDADALSAEEFERKIRVLK